MTPLARWARVEWGLLYATVRGPLAKRRLRAVPMTVGAVCLTALLQFAQNQSWGYGFVQGVGAVRAAGPLWASLLRTPLSLFVPALDLPVWGALTQVLVVFGIAEVCLGWWRTLAVAYVATLAGTLYARTGIAMGPHGPLGLPASDARVVDTGPSAAVVGLAVYLGWRYGAYVTAGAVAAAMAVEVALKDNLAGKEHLAAIAGTAALCAAVPAGRRLWHRWRWRWRHRRPGSGPGPGPWPGSRSGSGRSGLPPIQS
ncbi:hypothetical protein [Streptomyces sp. NPDC001507]|uniref:hypothetical protein n=1 Tax=Streptomyces sp. NPDC001507 TaxID=3364579 RepID=UPI0036BD5361